MDDSLTETSANLFPNFDSQIKNFDINLNRLFEIYLQIKEFRHFR